MVIVTGANTGIGFEVSRVLAARRARVLCIAWDHVNAERSYDRSQRYADSKLANMLFLFELDRRLRAAGSPVAAVGCHPGIAATDLGATWGRSKWWPPWSA